MKVTRGREVKLTGVLSWQEVDKKQKSPFAFSKERITSSLLVQGMVVEREVGTGKKKPPIILISLSKLTFAEVTILFS